MHIAFLSRDQKKVSRGAEVFVSELSKRLAETNSVDVLADKESDSIENIVNGKYDIVIPINGRMQSLKVSLARPFGKYKLLITGQSGIGRDDIWNITVVKPDIFVALTDNMKQWAKKWAWGSKVIKIPNGIDLGKFSPDGAKIEIDLPRPIILSVGALVWYKYHDRVIEALSRLSKGSLLIVGDGPLKKDLMEKGKKLKNRFKIMSFQYEDMPKVYRAADLFTLPSWEREAFGIVYLEALASGLGVVAPDDLSRKEIIGEGGFLVNVNNIEEYAGALDQALSIDWSKKARDQAEQFSWDIIAKKYEEVILDISKK